MTTAKIERIQRVGEPGYLLVVEKGGKKSGKNELAALIESTVLEYDTVPIPGLDKMSLEQLRAVLHLCERLQETETRSRDRQLVERGGLMCPMCDEL